MYQKRTISVRLRTITPEPNTLPREYLSLKIQFNLIKNGYSNYLRHYLWTMVTYPYLPQLKYYSEGYTWTILEKGGGVLWVKRKTGNKVLVMEKLKTL